MTNGKEGKSSDTALSGSSSDDMPGSLQQLYTVEVAKAWLKTQESQGTRKFVTYGDEEIERHSKQAALRKSAVVRKVQRTHLAC